MAKSVNRDVADAIKKKYAKKRSPSPKRLGLSSSVKSRRSVNERRHKVRLLRKCALEATIRLNDQLTRKPLAASSAAVKRLLPAVELKPKGSARRKRTYNAESDSLTVEDSSDESEDNGKTTLSSKKRKKTKKQRSHGRRNIREILTDKALSPAVK